MIRNQLKGAYEAQIGRQRLKYANKKAEISRRT